MPIEISKVIEQIMVKTGKSKEELQLEMQKFYNEFKDIQMNEEEKKAGAVRRLVAYYRKSLSSNAQIFQGIIIGASDPMDMVARRRAEALKKFKEDPEGTIAKGITNEKGEPLVYATEEQIDKMQPWMKKRIGTVLPDHDYQRVAYGLINMESKMTHMVFRIRGENIKVDIPKFCKIKFNGYPLQSSTAEMAKINDSGTLNFTIEGELTDVQITEMFGKFFKPNMIKLHQFSDYLKTHQDFDRFIIVKATVTEILPNPTSGGSQMIRIEDETMEFFDTDGNIIPPIVCFVPQSVDINFPEKSEVYIIGQPNMTERGKSIAIYGIYTPTLFRNMVPKAKKLGTETDKKNW